MSYYAYKDILYYSQKWISDIFYSSTILFHKTSKKAYIVYRLSLFFICHRDRNFKLCSAFDNTKVFLTILSWIFVFCYIRFIKYFWELLFNKQSKIINVINLILILATVFHFLLLLNFIPYILLKIYESNSGTSDILIILKMDSLL